MKSILAYLKSVGFHIFLFSAVLLLFLSSPLYAQTHSDDELFDLAYEVYKEENFLKAAMYLLAYAERDPELMRTDPAFAAQVRNALKYSETRVQDIISSLEARLDKCQKDLTAYTGIGSTVHGLTHTPPTLDPRPAVLSKPIQISPTNGTTFDHYPRSTTVRWKPVPEATSYVLEIDCYHCCETNKWCTDVGETYKLVRNLTTTSYTFDFAGAQPGRWRVWVVDASGREGPKSNWWGFRYTQ
jgi:hypothetical protein